MESIEKQFFFSQYHVLDLIRDTSKSKIERVFYNPCQSVCILKTYYDRDLEEIYLKLKGIHHPNLTTVYDVLYCDGNTYIVEENIDGETLAEYLQINGKFSEKEVIFIIKEVCSGLEVLHNQNPPLIHRDIKPGNIMMRSDGSIKLIDFDTVRCYKEKESQDTILLGTKEYASPEHYGYGQTGIGSDIYSIGVTMHEMLTGKMLENHKVIYKGKLRSVICHCIQVDSAKRFHSVQELKKTLSTYENPWGGLSRNRRKIGILCVASFLAIVAGAFWKMKIVSIEKNVASQMISENKDDFIGKMGTYISTRGGTESYINMDVYDCGNHTINITFRSMTHGGVVSAQGKIMGKYVAEAEGKNVSFSLEWTDDGEVVVTRKGSTGYSDFDEFTENETFIDNSYYQVG